MNNSYQKLTLLLVDDSEDDLLMARTAFAYLSFPHKLETMDDPRQALDYLRCAGKYEGRKTAPPDLLLLDINMPVLDGFSLLRELKADPVLKKIPVIMLSSSSSQRDIARSYEFGAASYLAKPNSMDAYKKLIDGFGLYWNCIAALPE